MLLLSEYSIYSALIDYCPRSGRGTYHLQRGGWGEVPKIGFGVPVFLSRGASLEPAPAVNPQLGPVWKRQGLDLEGGNFASPRAEDRIQNNYL